jgi:hypothetical protein
LEFERKLSNSGRGISKIGLSYFEILNFKDLILQRAVEIGVMAVSDWLFLSQIYVVVMGRQINFDSAPV